MVSTAPMEKFGAMSTPVSGDWASQPVSCARRSSVQPVVPTTAWMPWRTQKSRLPITEAGVVSSTDDLGAGVGERLQLVAPAEGGDQFHVLGGLDGPYRLGTDTAVGAEDRHAQLAHRSCFLTGRIAGVERVRPSGDRFVQTGRLLVLERADDRQRGALSQDLAGDLTDRRPG